MKNRLTRQNRHDYMSKQFTSSFQSVCYSPMPRTTSKREHDKNDQPARYRGGDPLTLIQHTRPAQDKATMAAGITQAFHYEDTDRPYKG